MCKKMTIAKLMGIFTIGKAWQIEGDKSYNDSKVLQDYMRHIEQQSRGGRTHAITAAIYLTTLENLATLLRVQKTL